MLLISTGKKIIFIVLVGCIVLPANAAERFKYIDQNGFEYWLDDKSKIPPPIPIMYKYEDRNGITFWVNDERKIPAEYRSNAAKNKESADKSKSEPSQIPVEKKYYSTKISIANNVIIVPVTFRNKGRKIKAKMILDTGASVTTIYSALASKLHLNKNKQSTVRSINANGISSNGILTKVDHIEVDDKILANGEVVVIPSHSNIGADGLLGNSFLRFFNFTIDYDNQLLRWN
jgi:predicted aspartyl protease